MQLSTFKQALKENEYNTKLIYCKLQEERYTDKSLIDLNKAPPDEECHKAAPNDLITQFRQGNSTVRMENRSRTKGKASQ